MKLTIETNNSKITIEEEGCHNDIYEMEDIITRALIGIGFHPDSVKGLFCNADECRLESNEEL